MAWFGILLVANIFLCFVDTVTLLAALSTKPRPPAPAEGRSLHRARHVKLTPEEGMPQTCSICLCDFEEDEAAVQLPCSHVFHGECITAWLQRSRHCPMRCPELVLPPRRQSRPRGARGRPAEMLHQDSQPEPARYGAETLGEGNLSAATPGSPGPEEEGRAMAVVPSVPSLPGQVLD